MLPNHISEKPMHKRNADVMPPFSVYVIDESNSKGWCKWSEGLTMIIKKGDQTIKLNSSEIEQLVKTLPRTFGGQY